MRRFRFTLSLVALIAANLVPLFGVVALGWSVAVLVFLYWMENIVIGSYAILKLALVRMDRPSAHWSKLLLIPFFCVHFGVFCAVHGLFLRSFFGIPDAMATFVPAGNQLGPLFLPQLFVSLGRGIGASYPSSIAWALLGLMVSHGVSFVQNYLWGGEVASLSLVKVMFQPYARVAILHVAIIAAGFAVVLLGSPVSLLFILVAIKLCLDVVLHLKEHAN